MFGFVHYDMFPPNTYVCSLSQLVKWRNKPTNRLIESEQLHLPHKGGFSDEKNLGRRETFNIWAQERNPYRITPPTGFQCLNV